jgi:protein-tyrosine phosphatase
VSFRVLFVCTGNVCRSPAAELLFARAAVGPDIASASAGTTGLTGRGVDKPTAYALGELGIDSSRHVAQRLTAGLTNAADLILTATTEHRSAVVQQTPLAFRRTFTLREFARLGADLGPLSGASDPDVLRKRVAEVADQRGWVETAEPGGDDIGDPFGAGLEVAQACVAELVETVGGVIAALGLPGRSASGAPPA